MAITVTESTIEPASFSQGPVKMQIMTYVAPSGATSGTVTATRLKDLYHVIIDGYLLQSAAPTYSGNAATLAFTVPVGIAATLTKGGVTYTAAAVGAAGNSISVAYTGGATAGAEVVTVVGTAISVQIEDGVSTITEVRTAVNADLTAAALVTATGTSITPVAIAAPSNLSGGLDNGAKGTIMCFGR